MAAAKIVMAQAVAIQRVEAHAKKGNVQARDQRTARLGLAHLVTVMAPAAGHQHDPAIMLVDRLPLRHLDKTLHRARRKALLVEIRIAPR